MYNVHYRGHSNVFYNVHCKQILYTSNCTCNVHFTYITRIKMNILLYIVMYIVMYNKSANCANIECTLNVH
jgi:hypothetical protein